VDLRRPVIAMLMFAGLRQGELRGLYWHDIDFYRGTIRVRNAKTDAGVRIVHMLPILRRELTAYRDQLQSAPTRRVFATSSGAAIGASNLRRRILARAVDHANVTLEASGRQRLPDGLTPHSLRRTFASLLFALSEPPTYVMSQMGHTTPALTLAIYAREMSRRDGERERLKTLVADAPQSTVAPQSRATSAGAVRIIPGHGPMITAGTYDCRSPIRD
jgi:integrase